MFAIICGDQSPELCEIPVPECQPSEVRVRVSRCALNRVDLFMAQGITHGSGGGLGTVLGLEWAGIVDQVGCDVPATLKIGQPVMGSGRGAFAEYVVADWGRVLAIPDGVSDYSEAAALPIALQTMHDAMVTHGKLTPEKNILIHGAASSVGIMAAKIAQCYGNELIIGTSRSEAKLHKLMKNGITDGLNSCDPNWHHQISELTNGHGVDLVIDMLSGPDINKVMTCMSLEGRIINIGRLNGKKAEFDFNLHALKRISYVGVTFRTRTVSEVREITRRMQSDFSDFLKNGYLKIPVDSVFAFSDFQIALERMRADEHFGKIILVVRDF